MDGGIRKHEGIQISMEFILQSSKQWILIDILCRYTQWNLNCLASMLDVSVQRLMDVHQGKAYLEQEVIIKIVNYFSVAMGN